jgi:hypothetical protein
MHFLLTAPKNENFPFLLMNGSKVAKPMAMTILSRGSFHPRNKALLTGIVIVAVE